MLITIILIRSHVQLKVMYMHLKLQTQFHCLNRENRENLPVSLNWFKIKNASVGNRSPKPQRGSASLIPQT